MKKDITNMNIIKFNEIETQLQKQCVTIGQFDGLHLGHMELIKRCLTEAKKEGLQPTLITFNPTIDEVLKKDTTRILTLDEMEKRIEKLGFKNFIIIDFNEEIKNMPCHLFIEVLKANLDIRKIIVGFDFTFGRTGIGNVNLLKETFQKDLIVIKKVNKSSKKIGTSLIKQYIKKSKFKKANSLLGYKFYIKPQKKDVFTADNISILQNGKYKVRINGEKKQIEIVNKEIIGVVDTSKIEFIKHLG